MVQGSNPSHESLVKLTIMNARTFQLVLGFILAGSGLFALILMFVGVQLNYLVWIDNWGGLIGLVLRLLMIMGGATLIALSTTNWKREMAEIEEYKQQLANSGAKPSDN